jgi:NADPH-dependent 2,4-dienoyl-CoA reductase/sulfur reductase-like enzyme
MGADAQYLLVVKRSISSEVVGRAKTPAHSALAFWKKVQNHMKLLVLGATGATGLEIVRQATQRGHQITAFVRSPERLKPFDGRINFVQGNLLDSLQLMVPALLATWFARCYRVPPAARGGRELGREGKEIN